jgi:hypothetical protein
MTDEQINAAIAEACGWTGVNAAHRSGKAPEANYVGVDFIPKLMRLLDIFDPIHEPMLATPRQRAEAFLRALGKWEEVQG